MSFIKTLWLKFWQNYRWSDYVKYVNGWAPKWAFFLPIVGGLTLFNDEISELLGAGKNALPFYFDNTQSLLLLCCGLLFLGASNLIYFLGRPPQFRNGTNIIDYIKIGFEACTLPDYCRLHEEIESRGRLTLYGRYEDSEWKSFFDSTKNTGEGEEMALQDEDWEKAKLKYADLLRKILYESFSNYDRQGKFWLSVCIALSTFGYILMLLPIFDLLRVVLD